MADVDNTMASREAIERNMPKIFDVEDKVKLRSSMLEAVKDWKVGEDYKVELTVTELASRELKNDEIEAEFEIKSARAV